MSEAVMESGMVFLDANPAGNGLQLSAAGPIILYAKPETRNPKPQTPFPIPTQNPKPKTPYPNIRGSGCRIPKK